MDNGSLLKAEFTFYRNPSYMVLNVYTPSFFIMVMTVVPLYLSKGTHFGTAITIVLTSMLCLYTLIQSNISQIPKTAYLKLIDYWNILALTVTQANFFTLILWEIFNHNWMNIGSKNVKLFMRTLISLGTLSALIAYWIIAGIIYFSD